MERQTSGSERGRRRTRPATRQGDLVRDARVMLTEAGDGPQDAERQVARERVHRDPTGGRPAMEWFG